MKLNTLMIYSLICSFTACSGVRTNKIDLKGVVYDSESESPVKNAKVGIRLTEPWEVLEATTGDEGEFLASSDGEIVFFDSLLASTDNEKITRKVTVFFTHPDFVDDNYEEDVEVVPVNSHAVDVGAFYLAPRDKYNATVDNATVENTPRE